MYIYICLKHKFCDQKFQGEIYYKYKTREGAGVGRGQRKIVCKIAKFRFLLRTYLRRSFSNIILIFSSCVSLNASTSNQRVSFFFHVQEAFI